MTLKRKKFQNSIEKVFDRSKEPNIHKTTFRARIFIVLVQ